MSSGKVEFRWCSDDINNNADKYWPQMLDIARRFTLARIMKCCTIMGRAEGTLDEPFDPIELAEVAAADEEDVVITEPAAPPSPVRTFDAVAARRACKKLTVPKLRAALEAAGADTKGLKAALVARLVEVKREAAQKG